MLGRYITFFVYSVFLVFLAILSWMLINGCLIDNVWIATPSIGGATVANTPNVIIYSTDVAPYGFDVENSTLIKFKVKSSRDAVVTLIADYNIPILYDLEIGVRNNQHSFLLVQNGHGSNLQTYTPDILDCDEFRSFWIGWAVSGEIRFGKGLIPFQDEVMHWVAGTPWDLPILGLSLRTVWGSHGTWIIHNKANHIGKFCGQMDTFADMGLLGFAVTQSAIECTMHCHHHSDCLAINFHIDNHGCRLISGNQLIVTSNMENWVFMTKCLQGINACLACI